jgi:cytochrome c
MVGSPKAEAPGTKMTFPGEHDPQKRADILAYLQSLSDSPVPFPK